MSLVDTCSCGAPLSMLPADHVCCPLPDSGEVWEVRPSGSNFDICIRGEPEAKALAVVATVFSGEAVARQVAQAHNETRTTPANLNAPDKQEALAEGVEAEELRRIAEAFPPKPKCNADSHFRPGESLKEYFARNGTPANPKVVAEYERAMREECIPAIERALKAQHRAAHYLRLGIPDPEALAGDDRNGVEWTLRRVECVPATHPFPDEHGRTEADPIWRIEIDGYCADFDSEPAARNFAAAITALSRTPSSPQADEADVERATLGDRAMPERIFLRHIGGGGIEWDDKAEEGEEAVEYVLSTMTTRPAGGEGVERQLNAYRAAVSWIAADAWDGCHDCMDILRFARSLDTDWDWAGDPDRVAVELRKVREGAALTKPAALPKGEDLDQLILDARVAACGTRLTCREREVIRALCDAVEARAALAPPPQAQEVDHG